MIESTIPVLFGTMTGNARDLVETTSKALTTAGFPAEPRDMAEAKPEELSGLPFAFFIISTWGEGEPPDDAAAYVERFQSREPLHLEGLRYSVCALGDTSYELFCGCGKILDESLTAHGAVALVPRVDCDVDYFDLHEAWQQAVLQALAESAAITH